MRTLDELLAELPAFAALSSDHRATIAGCARNVVLEEGAYLMREGRPADAFYVVRHGSVALETYVPRHGPMVIETMHEGDLVGWSWLVPPHVTSFDARATSELHAIAFDGICLRGKADADPELGYALLKLFAPVIVERLQHTRVRLLDLYGKEAGAGAR
jgi:CRP-like cAMP-binding protein